MVECDIRRAQDGEIVLAHHDEVVDISGNRYQIGEHTAAELRALDLGAGEGVPTLSDLVAVAAGRFGVMADMKCGGGDVEAQVAAALAPLPPEAKVVPGADAISRSVFRALDPALPLSLTLSQAEAHLLAGNGFLSLLDTLDTEAVTWQYPLLTPDRIAVLHAHGKRVYAWTVDDLPTMQWLLESGVDGLISNRPDLLAQIA